jgi:hypothetical protein
MVNKFKRGLTAEEAALIASNLERFDSLLDAKRTLQLEDDSVMAAEAELTNPYNDMGYASMSWDDVNAHKIDFNNLNEAKLIREALLDEVSIACEWHDYLSGEVELYIHDCITQPQNETPLEVFQIRRMAPDDEYSFCPIPAQTTIKKVSLAKWFYNHLPEKANLFDPTESYKTLKTGYSLPDNSSNSYASKTHEQAIDTNSFPLITRKLKVMLDAQNMFWLNYDKENLPSQKAISNFITEQLGLNQTTKGINRTAAELAKAIQPDEIQRK